MRLAKNEPLLPCEETESTCVSVIWSIRCEVYGYIVMKTSLLFEWLFQSM